MTFIRDDGQELRIIRGFRDRVLTYRASQTPHRNWVDDDYNRAIKKRIKRYEKLINKISLHYGRLDHAEALEIGCGDGINTLLLGLRGVKRAVGIDLDLRLSKQDEKGEAVRRLADGVIKAMGVGKSLNQCLENQSAELLAMDATQMSFPENSFDLIISRSVLEHIPSIDKLYSEIERVLRPGCIIYHEIDPFSWLRGCHKRGLVDIPWAHARLTSREFYRFVSENEGARIADKRLKRVTTLNHQTLKQWKFLHENSPFEIVDWQEITSPFAETILEEYPEVTSTLLPEIETNDLIVSRICVSLRKRN